MDLRIEPYDEGSPLVAALSDEMVARYGGGPAIPADPSEFLVFLVVAEHGADVGCGGLRLREPGIGEIKRMFVDPVYRGRGASRLMLRALLEHARAVGLAEVWLETGIRQPEAISLYKSEGFDAMEPYGDYKDEPESRCFRLALSATPC